MSEQSTKDVAGVLRSSGLVRAVPRYHHQSGAKQGVKLEYWAGDDQWRKSLHLHWNWMGRGHWLCIFLPEWLGRNS